MFLFQPNSDTFWAGESIQNELCIYDEILLLYNNIIRGKGIYLEKTKLLTGFLAALNGDLIRHVLLTRP